MTALSRPAWLALVGSLFVLTVVSSIRIPLLPEIGSELSLSTAALGTITAGFGLGRMVANLPAGWLADKVSPTTSAFIAAAAMAVGTATIALSAGFVVLIVGVVIAGAASAMMNTTAMTALTRSARPDRRGAAMATYSTSLMSGQVVGPAMAGIAASILTWRAAHGLGIALAVAVASALVLVRLRDQRGPAPDAASPPSPPEPPAAPDRMTLLQLAAVTAVAFAVFFGMSALPQTLYPILAADEIGMPVEVIGFAMAGSAIARIAGAQLSGRIADKVSRRAAIVPSLFVLGASAVILVPGSTWALWLTSLLVFSAASSGVAIAGSVIGDLSSPDRLGKRMGVYRTLGDLGLLTGGTVSGVLYDLGGRIPPLVTVAAVCAAAGIFALVALPAAGLEESSR